MSLDINYFKERLEKEKIRLEGELDLIAKRNPTNPNDWDAKPDDTSEISFHDEVADRFEEQNERKAAEVSLEAELLDVRDALVKIANNTYGRCEVSDEEIEIDRLEANPAARTCKVHLNQL
jgi:DnaK suppressor protein